MKNHLQSGEVSVAVRRKSEPLWSPSHRNAPSSTEGSEEPLLIGLRKRTLSALMVLLLVSTMMPGCLSLVLGREMMEGARGEPEIRSDAQPYDLSHTFIVNGTETPLTQIQKTRTEQIPIDYTVEQIVINFQTTVNWYLGDSDQRYVHVELLWCDETGINCDTSNPIYEVMADNGSYPQEQTNFNRDITPFEDGLWRLTVEGRGGGTNTGIGPLDFEDEWILRVTVVRPCLVFPESTDICTPTIEFE